jgi:hypothetical protein
MIKAMKAVPASSSCSGSLYEAFAAKELAAGESTSELVSMKTEKRGETTFFVPKNPKRIVSPFNRRRERSYASFSTAPLTLEFNVPPEKSLADYFWIPMASNNPPFDDSSSSSRNPLERLMPSFGFYKRRRRKITEARRRVISGST